jgi:hypothetical protein
VSIRLPYGTYKGATHSDSSPMVMCELRMDLNEEGARLRIATGEHVEDDLIEHNELVDMTPEQIAREFNDGTDISGVIGMQIDEIDEEGVRFLLLREMTDAEVEEANREREPGEPIASAIDFNRLIIRGLPGEEVFGYSMLFTPEQVEAGCFDRFLARLTAEAGEGMFPRIEYDGKPKPE